jgi:imidazolonepropionase-like amidohydrolase
MIRLGILLAALLGSPSALADVTALVGGTVLDGTGGPPLRNGVVVIDGERIVAVGPAATTPIPDGATRISTEGMTVLPGLWDLAVNLMRLGHASERRWNEQYVPLAERVVMPLSAAELLAAGVTSARDIGSPPRPAASVRERIRSLRIDGPTLYVPGPRLTADPEPGAGAWQWPVADAAAARVRVDALVTAGVDYVLLADLDRWAPSALDAAVAAARARGLPVQAYVRRATEIEPALAAGVDGFVGDGPATPLTDGVLLALRQHASTPGRRPFTWAPAISAVMNFEALRADPEPLDDPRLLASAPRVISQDVLASLADIDRVTWYDLPSTRRSNQCAKLAQLRDAGLTVVIGSNAGAPAQFPRGATVTEIIAWVRDCHVAPELAIRAATLDAAFAMGAAGESGSLTPGKHADVIAVYGDVLRQVERLAEPAIVIRRGRRYR